MSDDEDLSALTPQYLKEREPTLRLVALLAILDPPREEVCPYLRTYLLDSPMTNHAHCEVFLSCNNHPILYTPSSLKFSTCI